MNKLSGRKKQQKSSYRVRRLKLIAMLISGCMLVLLFLLFKYDPLVPNNREIGSIVNVLNTQSRYGSGTYYIIKLESGEKVKVNAYRMGPFKKNRVVVVEKMESKIFHKVVYRFIEYKN